MYDTTNATHITPTCIMYFTFESSQQTCILYSVVEALNAAVGGLRVDSVFSLRRRHEINPSAFVYVCCSVLQCVAGRCSVL